MNPICTWQTLAIFYCFSKLKKISAAMQSGVPLGLVPLKILAKCASCSIEL
jgi:hypothetical protein